MNTPANPNPQSYKVYDTGRLLFPYTVEDPHRWVIAVTSTRWGARRAIEKDIAKQAAAKLAASQPVDGYWNSPVVEERPA